MSNMSYCRFRNTSGDMDDCIQAIRDGNIENKDERIAAKGMLKGICEFLEDYGIVEEVDEAAIEGLIDGCAPRDDD